MKIGSFISVGSVDLTQAEIDVIENVLGKHHLWRYQYIGCNLLSHNYYAGNNLNIDKPIRYEKKGVKYSATPHRHSITISNCIDKSGNTQYSADVKLLGSYRRYRSRRVEHGEILNYYTYNTCLNELLEEIVGKLIAHRQFYLNLIK